MSDFIDWLSKYLGIEKNQTAAIIVSLSVFCLGIIINETIKAIARFRERRVVREIVKRNYLIFRSYLIDQEESLRKFENLVTLKGSPNFNAHILPCSALDYYKDISYNNSFKAFFVGFENIRIWGKSKRIEAFDNLYHSLSSIKIEQERMFPIVASFPAEAIKIIDKLNISLKEAFEEIGDVGIKLNEYTPNQELTTWLDIRSELHENCFAKGDPDDLNEIRNYFVSLLDFEINDRRPLSLIMSAKESWFYHQKIHKAIGDFDALNKLVKNTKTYCNTISQKFILTAQQLEQHYEPLFGEKIRNSCNTHH